LTQDEVQKSLELSVELGCNFFDTAWGYAEGKSEQILGKLLKSHADKKLYAATKIPPKSFTWPSKSHFLLKDCFPASHIVEYTEKLKKLGGKEKQIELLQQFHVCGRTLGQNQG
jgi:aryl-alcohol dehydrogenase-like predicted oxidoreductase